MGLCEDAQNRMKRASILLHIRKDPDYKDPPKPKYLDNMADPKDSKEFSMISFYSFPPEGVKDPEVFRLFLRKMWKPFAALGRVSLYYIRQKSYLNIFALSKIHFLHDRST